jgi:hypothetical protein
VSYFRPPKARKTGPWSITRLSNSTQKMSQKGGRVKVEVNKHEGCDARGGRAIWLFWESPEVTVHVRTIRWPVVARNPFARN